MSRDGALGAGRQPAMAPALARLPRVALVHGPTPLSRRPRLDARLGVELWIKHDDCTGGAEAGNKLRKLEFLVGDALARGRGTLVTCGGIQSNHARATALVAARHGLRSVLLLRVGPDLPTDPLAPAPRDVLPAAGNVLLDRLAGAEVRFVSREDYAHRPAMLERVALALEGEGRKPYVIPEGGSNGLGSLGHIEGMREVRAQLDAGLAGGGDFDEIVHACGSGGTAAGIALGAGLYRVARRVRAVAVCDDATYFERVVDRVSAEARGYAPDLPRAAELVIDEHARGPGYGVASAEQLRSIADVARDAGLVLDPVYTGKAFFGLERAIARGEIARRSRVLFVHTGGLPGLLAQGDALAEAL